MKPYIIAHRGASYLAKQENTIEAFKLAIEMKADFVEFDVRQTQDGELVVYHDSTFDDTPVSWLTYKDMKRKAEEKKIEIPKLMDVLDFCKGKIKLDIELKATGYERKLVRAVKSMYDYDEFMIKSFIDSVPAKIKRIDSNIKTGLLVGKANADIAGRFNEYFPGRRLKAAGVDFVAPHYQYATYEFVKRMKRRGFEVYVWTVNSPELIMKMVRRKVDGIITDKPDAAMYIRKALS